MTESEKADHVEAAAKAAFDVLASRLGNDESARMAMVLMLANDLHHDGIDIHFTAHWVARSAT